MRLAFDLRGDAERVVLLLHGFTGSRESWAGVEHVLLPHFRLLRVDLPGHGASPLPSQPGREGFFETLQALVHVLDEAGAEEVDVVGYSQGARVALGLAHHAGPRVGRVILESGSPGLHRRRERAERRRADALLAQEILRDGVRAFATRWAELPLFDGVRRLASDAQAALQARRCANSAEGLAGALGCLGVGTQPDYWPVLWKFHHPTLLLTGAEDSKFTAIARRMAAELPMVWSHAFAGVGHAPHLEVPEDWAREVVGFLKTPWFEVPVVAEPELRSNA